MLFIEYKEFIQHLPEAAHAFLKKELDWDKRGVNKDLDKIACSMGRWEVTLSSQLNLSQTEIEDLKTEHSKEPPELLR